MNLFELQQWIEQDQVLLFHLKHKAKGTIRHLEKGKKSHVNLEKLLLVETGILASCYQERDLIYALTPPSRLFTNESARYLCGGTRKNELLGI